MTTAKKTEPPWSPRHKPAGFWLRAGALVIDTALIFLIQAAMELLAVLGVPRILTVPVQLAAHPAYFTWMHAAYRGQTVGKIAAGIAVHRADGSLMTPQRCFARWLGLALSFLTLGVGLIAAAFTREKRALHDLLAGTRVTRVHGVGPLRKTLVILAAALPVSLTAIWLAAGALAPSWFAAEEFEQRAYDDLTVENLRTLRTYLSLYYAESGGRYPPDLNALLPRYLDEALTARTGRHYLTDETESYPGAVCPDGIVSPLTLRDSGRWGYVSDEDSACWGLVFVDCTHTDTKGTHWYSY